MEIADEGIRSNMFYGYLLMVDIIAFLVLWLEHWYDSCACHAQEIQAGNMSSFAKRARLRARLGGECVMNSRRAPEMAVGAMMSFMGKLMEVGLSALRAELAQIGLVDEESVGIILQEFTRARRYIHFTMVVKHSYWFHEPWCMFGIGHRNLEVARRCARMCLRLRTRLLAQPTESIHALTKFVLFNERMLSQLIEFANGRDMADLKDLIIVAALFRFAYTSELVLVSNDFPSVSRPFCALATSPPTRRPLHNCQTIISPGTLDRSQACQKQERDCDSNLRESRIDRILKCAPKTAQHVVGRQARRVGVLLRAGIHCIEHGQRNGPHGTPRCTKDSGRLRRQFRYGNTRG